MYPLSISFGCVACPCFPFPCARSCCNNSIFLGQSANMFQTVKCSSKQTSDGQHAGKPQSGLTHISMPCLPSASLRPGLELGLIRLWRRSRRCGTRHVGAKMRHEHAPADGRVRAARHTAARVNECGQVGDPLAAHAANVGLEAAPRRALMPHLPPRRPSVPTLMGPHRHLTGTPPTPHRHPS